MNVTVQVEISAENLANVLDGANFGYWGEYLLYADAADILAGNAVAFIAERPDDDGTEYPSNKLDADAIANGLAIMARDYPRHFHDILSEQYDSITGDILVQLSLFGDTKFG